MLCDKLTVTGDDYASATGTYLISEEKVSKSPNTPVYKLQGKDRYIYYSPSWGAGWRIGAKEDLSAGETEGYSKYRSKNIFSFLSKCAYFIDNICDLIFKVVLTLLNHGWCKVNGMRLMNLTKFKLNVPV